jgi:hypothetical protein
MDADQNYPPPASVYAPPDPPKLLDRVRDRIRRKGYSLRTEQSYAHWIRRFILFNGKRHPQEMGAQEVEAFLTSLAVEHNVAAATQNLALSAILFRISEWGITPNRAAVLGGNGLILINLLLVTAQLFKVLTKTATINDVRNTIASYLPVYCLWTIIVTFIFPMLFGYR